MTDIPDTASAVQLVGPNELLLNTNKTVPVPGPHQILCRVEVCGLCFSDLKLLKQFTNHVRKSEVVSGIGRDVLAEIPSYVPGAAPTVPGHETVVTVVRTGEGVDRVKPGDRFLVQTDWRWIRTEHSNGAFGYNFEGALQEYVLLDERICTSPEGESMLIPASSARSVSAVALVEPWACVEQSYQSRERQTLKTGGKALVVADGAAVPDAAKALLAERTGDGLTVTDDANLEALDDEAYDDVLYFGSNPDAVETLFAKTAPNGLLLIMQCGGKFARPVTAALGRFHYGGIRLAGTVGDDPAAALKTIPATAEIREGDAIHVVGAGGPMGVMHVMRNICQGVPGISVVAADLSDERLAALDRIAAAAAKQNEVGYSSYNPATPPSSDAFGYAIVMAPVPKLVAAAVAQSGPGGVINIFAGIPASVSGEIDLDAYVARGLYIIGTSGSTMEDMRIVLRKVEAGSLDTNVSVAAVCGLDGAVDGIRMVENQEVPGKIMVYPACKGLEVTALDELSTVMPEVAAELRDGIWTQAAEQALLARYD